MKKNIFVGFFISLIGLISCRGVDKKDNLNPDPYKNGYIYNETTAIAMAEVVLVPIYGDEILNEKPFKAVLKNDSIWVVEGTLSGINKVGGTAYIEINKYDGRILELTHSK